MTSSVLVPVMDLLSRDILQEKEAHTQLSNNLLLLCLTCLRNQDIWVVELLQIATCLDS